MKYFNGHHLRYLLSHPGFRERPAVVLGRAALWLAYCAVGHSSRFRLSRHVLLKVDPVLRNSGATSAFVLRLWAEPELRYLNRLLGEGDGFIDCGANIGTFTLRGAEIVGAGGRVVAIEPSSLSFRRLCANVDANRLSQVVPVKQAISDAEGTARLYHAADGGAASFSLLANTAETDEEFEEVATATIDRLAEQHRLERVDVIKLDIEGAEILALRGARETLRRFKPTVIFEWNGRGGSQSDAAESPPALLASHGYRLYEYDDAVAARRGFHNPNLVAMHPDRGRAVPSFLKAWSGGGIG